MILEFGEGRVENSLSAPLLRYTQNERKVNSFKGEFNQIVLKTPNNMFYNIFSSMHYGDSSSWFFSGNI